jgi:glycosyltransferase involved in cell wall biosynthesis
MKQGPYLPRKLRQILRQARRYHHRLGLIVDRVWAIGLADALREAARSLRSNRLRSNSLLPEPRPPADSEFDVIYAIGFEAGESKRYRVLNIAEGLRSRGYSVLVLSFDRIDDVRYYRWRATALVLFRAEHDVLSNIEAVFGYARSQRMRIIYDVDDLVFDKAIVGCIDGLRLMGHYQRKKYVKALDRRRRLLMACDLVSVSTIPLARAVEALGRPAVVIPNSIDCEQLRLAAQIESAPRTDDIVCVGYFSGSLTHQRDFACCEDALLTAMERHQNLRFRVVGHLDLGPNWDRFMERVERVGLLEPTKLLRCTADTDINIAPLEIGNPFCEAKSELKFFEAGLVGVPTIASATEPFIAAIEDGMSGLVVTDPAQWLAALELLISSEVVRREMGQAARRRALECFGPGVVTTKAIAALGLQPRWLDGALPARPGEPSRVAAAARAPRTPTVPTAADPLQIERPR